MPGPITLCLAGDVMLGRGIDQVMPQPSEPMLHEPAVHDARTYVKLAELESGPIPRPVPPAYVWGDALAVMAATRPDLRIVNLETAITTSDDWQPKGINYRMHPANIAVLTAAGIDVALLANNHVLDWGRAGLLETLRRLEEVGIATAGAGHDLAGARAPAICELGAKGRVVAWAMGDGSSGIPASWAAAPGSPGVNYLPDLGAPTAARVAGMIAAGRRPGDVTIASIHWGGNWGYQVPETQRAFARTLIEAGGVDLVFGHSSHHPKGIERHRGRPIVFGAGDLLNDYEGIGGQTAFRPELVCLYFATFHPGTSLPPRLRLVPFRLRRFRLERPDAADAAWLEQRLDDAMAPFGLGLRDAADGGWEVDEGRGRQ